MVTAGLQHLGLYFYTFLIPPAFSQHHAWDVSCTALAINAFTYVRRPGMTDFSFKLETKRLYLRNLTADDKEVFFNLNQDPEVLRYTGDAPFARVIDAAAFLAGYDQYSQYGYGRWAVIHKESQEFIGWCGLKYSPADKETDLGFRLFRAQWGQGFATEAASACLQYAFEVLQLPVVVGRVQRENKASIRVLEKIGMNYWKDFDFEGKPGLYYRIARPS